MEVIQAIEKRWGCRKYSDKPIDKEQIGIILDAGRNAPSAGNLQDRSFIVVKSKDKREAISGACGNQTWMQIAPVHIVIVAENKKNGKFFGAKGEKIYSIQDTAFSAQNMLLAATSLGVGCSLVVGFNEAKLKEALKIESPAEPYAVITLGTPLEPAKTSAKYPLDKFVYFDEYLKKADESVAGFEHVEYAKGKIAEKVSETKKESVKFMDKIKSLFKKKKMEKEEPIAEDHFMESKEKDKQDEVLYDFEEIPRELPRK